MPRQKCTEQQQKLKMDKSWKIYFIIILFCILNVESGIPNRSAKNIHIVPEKRSTDPEPSQVEHFSDIIQNISVPISNDVKRVDNSLMKSLRSIIAMSPTHLQQSKFFSVFDPIRQWIWLFIRLSYKSYTDTKPERELNKCIIRCVYVTYPNLMRKLQIQNIITFMQSFYSWFVQFISTAMNSMWTGSFQENDSVRIGSKVAALTQEDANFQSPTFNRRPLPYPYPSNLAYRNPNFYYYYYYPNKPYMMRRQRDVSIEKMEIRNDSQKQSYPLEPLSDINPMDDDKIIDTDASINLVNNAALEEAENLFSVEPMIMKAFGIEHYTIKKYTPMYCAKEYLTDVLERFTDDLLLD